nr:hypothetical protein [Tanacetum cinerariifolium]
MSSTSRKAYSQPWTTAEEIALCKAWCDVLESRTTTLNFKGFGQRFLLALRTKWGRIVKQRDENGSSDLVLFQNALAEYETQYGQAFTLEPYLFATNHLSDDPTFSSHTDLTSPEVINPLSGNTTSSSPDHLLEEFADELALITFPSGNSDLPFDIESDLREIEYLLNHDPTKEMDSILEDLGRGNSVEWWGSAGIGGRGLGGGFELRKVGKGRGNSVVWWGSAGIGGRGLVRCGGKTG